MFPDYINAIGQGATPPADRTQYHGHAVLPRPTPGSPNIPLTKMTIHDTNTSWLYSARGKALLYDASAVGFRNKESVLDLFETITQFASREGLTLFSLEGMLMTGWITTPWGQAAVNPILLAPLPRRKTRPPSGQLPGREWGERAQRLGESSGLGR